MAQVRILRYDTAGHSPLAVCDPTDITEGGRAAVEAVNRLLQAHRDHGYTAVVVTPGSPTEGVRVDRITEEVMGDIRFVPAIGGG